MISTDISFITSILAALVEILAIVICLGGVGSSSLRRMAGLFAKLTTLIFFASCLIFEPRGSSLVLVRGVFEVKPIAAYCGLIFNFVYILVFIAYGRRVFETATAGKWLMVQALISLGVFCERIELFPILLISSLLIHLRVSREDVYQVTSKRNDRFVVVVFNTILVIFLSAVFFLALTLNASISYFNALNPQMIRGMPLYFKVLALLVILGSLGAFPLHFWVRPLFASPARYGLAVITRINIGFIVWSKLYPFVYLDSGSDISGALGYLCAANLLYASLLLFGEKSLTQIASALYLFHIPLLLLAVNIEGAGGEPDFILDFANITVAISGLLLILGMLRDRLGAEELEHASGLGISYPFLGISFLVCVLSLVGFPGTLGFVSSEVMLHHFAEATWPIACCFIVTLALNGYSSFRIFGESFYGDPAKSFRAIFQPLRREKMAICAILLFLVAAQLVQSLAILPEGS